MKWRDLLSYLNELESSDESTCWIPSHRVVILIMDPNSEQYVRATYFEMLTDDDGMSSFVVQTERSLEQSVVVEIVCDETDTDLDVQLYKRIA